MWPTEQLGVRKKLHVAHRTTGITKEITCGPQNNWDYERNYMWHTEQLGLRKKLHVAHRTTGITKEITCGPQNNWDYERNYELKVTKNTHT